MGKGERNYNHSNGKTRIDSSEKEMAASLKFISDKMIEQSRSSSKQFECLISKLEVLVKQNSALQKEIDVIIRKTKELENHVHVLESQLNDIYQERINDNIVLKGIPEVDGSKQLEELVRKVLKHITLHIYDDLDDKILSIKRIGVVVADKTRPVIVRLISSSVKRDIIKSKRSYELNASMFTLGCMPVGSSTQKIYIDEHLTKSNFALYMQARALRKSGVKYVWTHNGCTFIKITNDSKAVRIRHLDDLYAFQEEFLTQIKM